jgi:hypothetical protein
MARILILALIGIVAAAAAQAEIGAVGNPYNLPPPTDSKPVDAAKPAAAVTSDAKAKEEQKPLLEVTFDKNYVNYSDALNQGVAAAEKAKPNVVYNVKSYLPAESPSSLQNKRMSERAMNNLDAVVDSLRRDGVPAERIHVSTEQGTGDSDSVKLFVQ